MEVPKGFQMWLILRMQNAAATTLKDHLLQLTDPRLKRRRRHELLDVLLIAITAMLCGAENFVHMAQFGKAKQAWLRTFLALPNGIPSHDTFRRVFLRLAPEKFLGGVPELDADVASGCGCRGGGAGRQDRAAQF